MQLGLADVGRSLRGEDLARVGSRQDGRRRVCVVVGRGHHGLSDEEPTRGDCSLIEPPVGAARSRSHRRRSGYHCLMVSVTAPADHDRDRSARCSVPSQPNDSGFGDRWSSGFGGWSTARRRWRRGRGVGRRGPRSARVPDSQGQRAGCSVCGLGAGRQSCDSGQSSRSAAGYCWSATSSRSGSSRPCRSVQRAATRTGRRPARSASVARWLERVGPRRDAARHPRRRGPGRSAEQQAAGSCFRSSDRASGRQHPSPGRPALRAEPCSS